MEGLCYANSHKAASESKAVSATAKQPHFITLEPRFRAQAACLNMLTYSAPLPQASLLQPHLGSLSFLSGAAGQLPSSPVHGAAAYPKGCRRPHAQGWIRLPREQQGKDAAGIRRPLTRQSVAQEGKRGTTPAIRSTGVILSR